MDSFVSFVPLIVLVLVFYFLIFRPQQQQRKRHVEMVTNLKRGDSILTNGGFVCKVIDQEDKFIVVRLGANTVKLSKDYVAYKIEDVTEEEYLSDQVKARPKRLKKQHKSITADKLAIEYKPNDSETK